MAYRIGEVEMQGEPSKVVQLFPKPKGVTTIDPYKSRFRRRREAMDLSTMPSEGVCDLSMRRADVVDTSPCETIPA